MPRNDFASLSSEVETARLANESIDELARWPADHVFAAASRPATSTVSLSAPSATSATSGRRQNGDALCGLRIPAHLSRAVERRASEEAARAAEAGAGHPQPGNAWHVTRQSARRRSPGLVCTATPTSRPIPPFDDRSHLMNTRRTYDVLLVEDDAADAMLIEEALLERGMARTINLVGDGVAALEYLRDAERSRPDLIVLDLNMPRMNGRELLAVLKDDADLLTIPVVVLTTSASPDDVTSAYDRHANAYVTKPVNLDDFLQAVRSIDAFFLDTAAIPPKR
jgi:CheY-like chemotaxis protein